MALSLTLLEPRRRWDLVAMPDRAAALRARHLALLEVESAALAALAVGHGPKPASLEAGDAAALHAAFQCRQCRLIILKSISTNQDKHFGKSGERSW